MMNEPNEKPPYRILIVDDNATLREAMSMVLGAHPDFRVVGTSDNAANALNVARETPADLALVDISLKGGCDGIQLIEQLKRTHSTLKVVVFSLHDEALYINAAREAGAHGYVTKSEAPSTILKHLRDVMNGNERFPKTHEDLL